jgi:hypothetical protein
MLERVQDDLDDAYGDAALLAHELLHKVSMHTHSALDGAWMYHTRRPHTPPIIHCVCPH